MYKVVTLSLFLMVFAGTLPQEKSVDIEPYLKKTVEEQVKKECETCQVELTIHNKQILDDVVIPDRVIADRWRRQTNLVLQMGEENRIVTVSIRWMDQVVIAKSNIRQGQLIAAEDVKTVEKDVTFLQTPYINKIENVIGWEPRKVFPRGQIIDEGYLKKPLVVKYGQTVKVEFQEGSLQLSMTGQAKGAGAIGDRIPVAINETQKRVSGLIIDKGRVRLE